MTIPDPANFAATTGVSALILFGGILLFEEAGRRLALRRMAETGGSLPPGTGTVDAAAFGLLGLLLAFSFAGAANRFDARRQQIVEEANDIGTAWLRLDLLPADSQPALRELFRQYLDARIAAYRRLPDRAGAQAELDRAAGLQRQIWPKAVSAAEATGKTHPPTLLLPAINAMFDIATTRTMATRFHQPGLIFALLVALSLVCAFLAGYGMAERSERSWMHLMGFAFSIALCVYVVYDLEYPRAGLIQLEGIDQVMVDLRASMQ
jgi:hypothetical protein